MGSEQRPHGESNGIAGKPAQPRLSVARLFHGRDAYHLYAIAKRWQRRSCRQKAEAGSIANSVFHGQKDAPQTNLADRYTIGEFG
jgi:hypothetical protein